MKNIYIRTIKDTSKFLTLLLIIFVFQNGVLFSYIYSLEKKLNIHNSIFDIGFMIFYVSTSIILLITKNVIFKHIKSYTSF